jgi:hypothetical protein
MMSNPFEATHSKIDASNKLVSPVSIEGRNGIIKNLSPGATMMIEIDGFHHVSKVGDDGSLRFQMPLRCIRGKIALTPDRSAIVTPLDET